MVDEVNDHENNPSLQWLGAGEPQDHSEVSSSAAWIHEGMGTDTNQQQYATSRNTTNNQLNLR
jgi:hypothetical protein